ncbi:MAG: ABC transporter permease [Bacilli bacterium]|jgi:oligopeptide transport system permease protein|nr:ABC transporter permease [Bacilli bacterium]
MNKKMLVYILKRLGMSIITILSVITITFWSMQAIPGGPFASEKALSEVTLAILNEKYGLNDPLGTQYLRYLWRALIWDFGPSLTLKGRFVMDVIADGLKISGVLGMIALIVALVFGIVLGALAAVNQNKILDRIIMVFSTASVAMPSFVIASLLLLIFCNRLRWFPSSAALSSAGYVLPVITLALYPTAYITRMTRSSTLDVLNQDFIRTARAKGLKESKVIFKHAMRNSLTPIITYIGPEFAYIITGSLVVEQVFSIGGLGRYFISSITGCDYSMIMGTTIFLTDIMVIMLLVSDILYVVANPKVDFD